MDTSEIYIKMCDCKEVQDNKLFFEPFGKGGKIWRGDSHTWFSDKGVILPRQDQIQELCDWTYSLEMSHHNGEYYTKIAKEGMPLKFLGYFRSLEQFRLAFYMHEKHNKKWDGEKWIKK